MKLEDVDIVALFFALDTQWRWHPVLGMRTGIDYAAIEPTAAGLGFAVGPQGFTDLRFMEAAALKTWA